MENEIMNVNSAPAREIGVVTEEIKELCRQAQRMALAYVIEIGRRLVEAKSVLRHGEWEGWLRDEVNFSQSTANNYMKLFAEYGDTQISLFGAVANSQALGNLPYSKALALLSVPSEEREEFAEKVDAENISLRELQSAIKERDAALAEAAAAKEREEELEQATASAEIARSAAERRAAEADSLRGEVAELRKKLESHEATEKKLREKLKDPTLPPEKLAEIKKAAEDEAAKNVGAELEKQLAEAQAKAEEAEKREKATAAQLADAERKREEAEKKLKTASPTVMEFKITFENVQKEINRARAQIKIIEGEDPETAEKLKAAFAALGKSMI